MALDWALVEGRKKRIADELKSTPEILAVLVSRRDFAGVGHNVDLMTRSLLTRGMMYSRVDHNNSAALEDFRTAAELALELKNAVACIQKSDSSSKSRYMDVAFFETPIYACLLAFDLNRAAELARLSNDPAVLDKEDPVYSSMVRMLATVVLDEEGEFLKFRERYNLQKKNRWWQYFSIYMDMYESLLARNQRRYDELTMNAEKAFFMRAADKKFGNLRPEYGGGSDNDMVLDFYAVGIGVLALTRGLEIRHFSSIVPRDFFVAGGLL